MKNWLSMYLAGTTEEGRIAFRKSITLISGVVLSLPLVVYLALQSSAWQIYAALATVIGWAILLSFSAARARQNQADLAMALVIGSQCVILPAIAALISGLGLILGLTQILIVPVLVAQSFSGPRAIRTISAGVISAALTVLIDLFAPWERVSHPLLQSAIPFIAIAIVFALAIYVFRQFRDYSLRTKLIITFVAVTVVAVSTLAIVTNLSNRVRLTQDVGANLTAQAESRALIVGETLARELQGLQSFGLNKLIQDRVERSSTSYTDDPTEIQSQIAFLDQQWRAADAANNDNNPLVHGVLNEIISSEFRKYRDTFPENVEVFVTDQYGANVGATNRTSDYYQADEDWWQGAYNNGDGAIYIGQPAFDESSETYASIIAIPLYSYNTNEIIGILRTTVDLTAITDVLAAVQIGQTGQVELYVADGQKIPAEGGGVVPGDPNALALPADSPNYAETNYDNQPSLVSRAPVTTLNAETFPIISQLGWSLVVHQDRQESLTPVANQTRTVTFISLILISLATLAAFFVSQLLASPVQSLTAVAEQITSGDLGARATITTQDEIGTLASSFNRMTGQLQDTLAGLEKRVAERTADVELARLVSEHRAQQLQAISEVSRIISTEQRLDILLPLVTRLASERFDFYHVGIFFVDSTKQFAVFQASNSEGGRKMLARGHRLEVGMTGIVGTVAQTGKARIALDVGSDATFFDNPDLPETRSEMALPLIFRGEIIGVLDVQSTKPGAFTEDDVNILSILADQTAIAIENARLFGETQNSRDEAEALYDQFLRTEWKTFLQLTPSVGYHQSMIGGKPIEKLVETDEIRQALRGGQVVVMDDRNMRAHPSLTIPVKLHGQTIGVLGIKAPTRDRQWNQDEINLAQVISDRLALALDNARLLQESQRRAAKEAKIGEVTSKIGASINMRNVLQTAVEELGRALPGSEVVIQFQSPEEN
jgi:GAF domain-containing protein/HAMP domain-containing protein